MSKITASSTSAAVSNTPPPRPVSPLGGAVEDAQVATFSWLSVEGALGYTVEVARDRLFQQTIVTVPVGAANEVTLTNLLPIAQTLYWRVRARTNKGETRWSPYGRFTAGSDSSFAAYRRAEESKRQARAKEQDRVRSSRVSEDSMLPTYQRQDSVPSDFDVKLAISLFIIPIAFTFIAYVIGRIAIG